MRRFDPHSLNHWLLLVGAVAVAGGWLAGYWTFGAGLGFTALCLVGARTKPRQAPDQSSIAAAQLATSQPPDGSIVDQLIDQGRTALLLRPKIAATLPVADREAAQTALDDSMAMVPSGLVAMHPRLSDGANEIVTTENMIPVEGLFLDRYAVTNREFRAFVESGGYEQMSLWDEAIWPAVLGFVDTTGQPGPRFWTNGTFLTGEEEHPVVGVSWYEAGAFARWVGKRLPTDAEWVKAASWPVFAEGDQPVQRRFPWGDAMDRKRTNIWGSGFERTIPVRSLPASASASGIEQLVGNVWEWTSTAFGMWDVPGDRLESPQPLKSIRGGAFDTYFESQANCHFQSGASPLDRKHNVGFRCALGFCDVFNMDEPQTAIHQPDAQARGASFINPQQALSLAPLPA
ncbi:MAG TPA: SUMF1/EgtB/PvdO family nonheme iron enzyme [Pirellulaceae bacterium]|jgi:iron(II)-dependent oxidoreductase